MKLELNFDFAKVRQCQPCTACCDGWLKADIYGAEVGPGKPCPHSTGSGCTIYENRPEHPCRSFECAWVAQGSMLPEWMRPSECGAIVILNADWKGEDVIKAIPVGQEIPEKTLEWLMAYSQASKRSLIFNERRLENGEFSGLEFRRFGPPGSHAQPPGEDD